MNTTTTNHPDFSQTLTAAQIAWCRENGIETTKDRVAGFYFSKGNRWVEPVRATDNVEWKSVCLMEEDRSEDGEGARCVAVFYRLREALAALRRG